MFNSACYEILYAILSSAGLIKNIKKIQEGHHRVKQFGSRSGPRSSLIWIHTVLSLLNSV